MAPLCGALMWWLHHCYLLASDGLFILCRCGLYVSLRSARFVPFNKKVGNYALSSGPGASATAPSGWRDVQRPSGLLYATHPMHSKDWSLVLCVPRSFTLISEPTNSKLTFARGSPKVESLPFALVIQAAKSCCVSEGAGLLHIIFITPNQRMRTYDIQVLHRYR